MNLKYILTRWLLARAMRRHLDPREIAEARRKHGTVRPLQAKRQQIIHEALRAGR